MAVLARERELRAVAEGVPRVARGEDRMPGAVAVEVRRAAPDPVADDRGIDACVSAGSTASLLMPPWNQSTPLEAGARVRRTAELEVEVRAAVGRLVDAERRGVRRRAAAAVGAGRSVARDVRADEQVVLVRGVHEDCADRTIDRRPHGCLQRAASSSRRRSTCRARRLPRSHPSRSARRCPRRSCCRSRRWGRPSASRSRWSPCRRRPAPMWAMRRGRWWCARRRRRQRPPTRGSPDRTCRSSDRSPWPSRGRVQRGAARVGHARRNCRREGPGLHPGGCGSARPRAARGGAGAGAADGLAPGERAAGLDVVARIGRGSRPPRSPACGPAGGRIRTACGGRTSAPVPRAGAH